MARILTASVFLIAQLTLVGSGFCVESQKSETSKNSHACCADKSSDEVPVKPVKDDSCCDGGCFCDALASSSIAIEKSLDNSPLISSLEIVTVNLTLDSQFDPQLILPPPKI
ncbi:MAG: hypothetical protein R3A13_02045 [Bdellovibrionota bacterium]